MTFAVGNTFNLSKRRGSWLRCFLGNAATVLLLFLAVHGVASAQLDIPGPFRVSRFQGILVTPEGKPVSDAEVTLLRDDNVVASTHTDASGHFRINHVDGHYRFRMHVPNYSIVNREVIVRFELATDFRRSKLYVILGPGACADDCSSVFTDKKDFDRIIRRNTRHH